ncbi:MAG: multicopper oxidase family protein [Betaproteobacteria bacterium]|nr:multicopper oxidase family protein [Betaproteobacteria bacterium]MSQ89255.1 multicopper oxidase family protein [Betaproteobacteria bacterium]
MKRRRFLALAAVAAGVSAAAPYLSARAQPAARKLRAAAATQALVGTGHPATAVWAYDGTVPGPELRFRQGERLRIWIENALDVATTVHWHGIRLPNAMDGVPHLTQPPIAANGGHFLYEFDLPDAGTYWYHPHLGSPEQVGRGLYGALIVEEREPPPVDRDVVWVLSDWRLDQEAKIVEDFRGAMDSSHAGRIGNSVTVNGSIPESFAVRAGERIRLRLINASNARIYSLSFEGHEPWLIAFDGQPLEPQRLANSRIVLAPAQRADLLLECIASPGSRHRVVDDFYPRRTYRLMDLAYSQEESIRKNFPAVLRLPANTVRVPEVAGAERYRIVFGGGMMGDMPGSVRGGMMGGMMGGGEHGRLFWTVNGIAVPEHDHRHEPLLTLVRDRSYVFELVNDTAWHHPIHLHGHVFQVLSRDGKPNLRGESGDTVLLNPRTRAEIAFVADNPGNWMLHCHILEHQASGMMAVVRVA